MNVAPNRNSDMPWSFHSSKALVHVVPFLNTSTSSLSVTENSPKRTSSVTFVSHGTVYAVVAGLEDDGCDEDPGIPATVMIQQ